MATQAPPAPAAPAPAAAPAPSAPTPIAEPTGSGAGDPLESLRNETIAWGHKPNQDTPTDPAPGSTPEAPDAGSTPPTDGQPAPTDAPTSSAAEAWNKRYGGDPEKAAQEAFALEGRIATMAQELKALKAGQTPAGEPAVPTTAAQPAVQPAPTQPPPTAPAQPAPPAETPADLFTQALQHASANDAECRAWISDHNKNLAQLEAIDKEIPVLQKQILEAQVLIAHPTIDEMLKDEQRQILQRAELTLAAREARQSKLQFDNQVLDGKFGKRVDDYVGQLHQSSQVKAREAAADKDADAAATEFVGHWPNEFERAFVALGLDPEVRADVHEAVKVAALARPGRIDLKDLPSFMNEALKAESVKLDKYHRIEARRYALRKNADTSPAAPTGPAATATAVPAPVTTEDQLDALRMETRAAMRSKRGA